MAANFTQNSTLTVSLEPKDTFNPEEYSNFYTFMGSFIATTASLGFFFNALVIGVLIKNFRNITNTNIIVLSMAFAHIIVPSIGSPLSATSSLMKGWQFKDAGCVWYGFVNCLSGYCSIYHLTFLSVERYITIVHPLKRDTLLNTRNTYIGIGIVWALAVAIAIAPVFGWCSYLREGVRTSCSVDWDSGENSNVFSYNVFLMVFTFLLPMIVIIYCNYRFIKEVSVMSSRARGLQGGDSEMSASASRAEKQLTIMVVLMIVAYNVAWSPYAVVCMLWLTGNGHLVTPMGASVPAMFAKTSVVYNPIIYCLLNRGFRKMICGNAVEPE